MSIHQFREGLVTGALALAALVVIPTPARAQGVRLTDKDVKALVEAIDNHADRFRDALDDRFKSAILRGPGDEVNIRTFLDDFEKNIERMRDRVRPEYAASTEVQAVLQQATSIAGYVKTQPAGAKGASEWGRVAADLSQLASAYGASFPLPDGAPVRRIGDRETVGALDAIVRDAARLKNSVGREKAIEKPQREAVKAAADRLTAAAKTLRSRVSDRKPATSEAEAVLNAGQAVKDAVGSAPVGLPTSTAVTAIDNGLAKVAQSFGVGR